MINVLLMIILQLALLAPRCNMFDKLTLQEKNFWSKTKQKIIHLRPKFETILSEYEIRLKYVSTFSNKLLFHVLFFTKNESKLEIPFLCYVYVEITFGLKNVKCFVQIWKENACLILDVLTFQFWSWLAEIVSTL